MPINRDTSAQQTEVGIMDKGWICLTRIMVKLMGGDKGNEGKYPVDASYFHEFADEIIHDPNWGYLGHWFPGGQHVELFQTRYINYNNL